MCEECGEAAAAIACKQCDVSYCAACCDETHAEPDIGDHSASFQPVGEEELKLKLAPQVKTGFLWVCRQ